jgi:hypothetical protein
MKKLVSGMAMTLALTSLSLGAAQFAMADHHEKGGKKCECQDGKKCKCKGKDCDCKHKEKTEEKKEEQHS